MMQEQKPLSKDERIKQRWDRICAKRAAGSGEVGPGGDDGPDRALISAATKAQIRDARTELDHVREFGWEKVTDIQVEADDNEAKRRRENEDLQRERIARIQEEIEESREANRLIEEQWAEFADKDVPQEIFAGILEQKQECDKVTEQKRSITTDFEAQFKAQSEHYVAMLKKQEEDVQNVLWRMHQEYKNLRDEYETQLVTIDEAFMAERKQILEQNKDESDTIFDKRRQLEMNIMEAKLQRDDEFALDLEKVRQHDQEEYQKLKMNLENNIQLLEQQLEEMRATYQLNMEKLFYNFQVLKEREKENLETVAQQKRKFKRLKEQLATLRERYQKSDHNFKADNSQLTDEYQRITKQYKDLQRKYKHFQRVDQAKFAEIWAMNEEEVKLLVDKTLKADHIVATQILGQDWQKPVLPWESGSESSERSGTDRGENAANGDGPLSPSGSAQTNSVASARNAQAIASGRFTTDQIQIVMELLVSEAAFLVDKKVKDMIRSDIALSRAEKIMYQADSILSALGAEDREDIEEIVALFYGVSNGETLPAEVTKPRVHPNDFVKVIRKFVSGRQQTQQSAIGSKQSASGQDQSREKSERKRQKERQYWEQLGDVIDDKQFRVWGTLETHLTKYNLLLEERAKMVDDTAALQQQNEQLKSLLKGYLSSDINHELFVPPTQMIDLNANVQQQLER